MSELKRPGYREAIDWLARNDDCYWLGDRDALGPILSVSASMIRDLFDASEERLIADLRRKLKQVHPNHEALNARI